MWTGEVMNRILIVDGNNLLFQMFFGMPARIANAQGVGIWGVLGFTGALLKMLRRIQPTHVAVLFDGEHENARAAEDEAYKANRISYADVPAEENPFSQLGYVCRALDFLRIAHAETTDCEADDWIAGYARRYGVRDSVILSSFDSDFFQLIGPNVTVLRYRGEKTVLCDEAFLQQKYGVSPDRYADFKALTGDAADNIRGADKVGPKTAAALLQQFGSLEGVLQNAERIARPSVRHAISAEPERLRRNYRLIHLEGDCQLPFELPEMRYVDNGVATMDVLRAIGL